MERILKICLTLFLCCVIGLIGTLWVHGEEADNADNNENELSGLYARAAVLADGETGRILWGKNENEQMAMASTTKIMTCLLALENGNMDDVVEISSYAAGMPDVQLNAVAGDTFRLEDLLYSLMLQSHNDVAVAIAEHIGGSVENFAELMNERAASLGCTQTHFVTPNGLDAEGHYTTAAELAKIASEAIKNEDFVRIINTTSHSFSNIERTRNYSVSNADAFLQMMDGAFGVKTGFTGDAGYCFVGALKRDERIFISVVLASGWPPNKSYKWKDTMKLMDFGLTNYVKKEIGMDSMEMGSIEVRGGNKDTVQLAVDCHKESLLMRQNEEYSVRVVKDLSIAAPVAEGTIVGWVYYQAGNEIIDSFPVKTAESVNERTFIFNLDKILSKWLTEL